MKKLFKKKTTSEIALRKWCVEQAVKITGVSGRVEWTIVQAQQLYDWITSTKKESDQKFGVQLRK